MQEDEKRKRLFTAVLSNNLEAVEDCIKQGADPDMGDIGGMTALHLAAREGFAVIAKALISKGADVNVKDNVGNTPLHLAAAHGRSAVVGVLAEAMKELNPTNKLKNTPMQLAEAYGHYDVTKFLKNPEAEQ